MDTPSGPDAAFLVYEDTVEPCPHHLSDEGFPMVPQPSCPACKGAGYRLTKRIYRATDRNHAALEAILKSKDALLEKAANTLDTAAALFQKLGHPKESAETKAAAQALRESAG